MSKLHKKYEQFDAQNSKWRFDVYFEGTDAEPVYRVVLMRWLDPSPEEVALINTINGEMAHAFIENDAVVDAYITSITVALQEGTLKA